MSGRQHRIARREAYNIATTKNFWKKCQDFMPKRMRFFGAIFPWSKRKLLDRVAKLYRFNLERLTQEVYNHRPGTPAYREWLSLQRAKRKAEKARVKKQLKAALEAKAASNSPA
jgi:hypothetical protein